MSLLMLIIMLVEEIESFVPSIISSSNLHHDTMLLSQIDGHNNEIDEHNGQSISRRDTFIKDSENNIKIDEYQKYAISYETISRRDMLIKNAILLSSISSITTG
eukprot:162358_1